MVSREEAKFSKSDKVVAGAVAAAALVASGTGIYLGNEYPIEELPQHISNVSNSVRDGIQDYLGTNNCKK